jgi:hypothetical protein
MRSSVLSTLMRRERAGSLLAGLHAGDGGADEGDVVGAALHGREIRVAEIEEDGTGRSAGARLRRPSIRACGNAP